MRIVGDGFAFRIDLEPRAECQRTAVDVDFVGWLEENMAALVTRDTEALATAIVRSCEVKSEVVAGDERESGD